MISAFGVEHFSKGLKPQHVAALKQVAAKPYNPSDGTASRVSYARDRLDRHELGTKYPDVRGRMTGAAGMYHDMENISIRGSAESQQIKRGGKTGIRVMEGPKIKYGRRKGHLRVVEGSS